VIKKPVRAAGRKWEDVRSELEDWIRGATLELDRLFIRPLAGTAVAIPQAFSHQWTFVSPAAPILVVSWRAPAACRAVQFSVWHEGAGTDATVTANRDPDALLAAPILHDADGGWISTTDLINADFVAGSTLELEIVGVTGVPDLVVIQVDFLNL
jgi:hypothetical protein